MTTLTTAEAQQLFTHAQAILEGRDFLTTRTAAYQWNPTVGQYDLLENGLEVAHRPGVRWHKNKKHFVVCTCRWCQEHPLLVAEVDIVSTKEIGTNS